MSLEIRPLSYSLGAEIIGVDLQKPLDNATFREVHQAFLDHQVILFRGQRLTQEQHIAFTRYFGDVHDSFDLSPKFRHPKYPEIGLVFNPSKRDSASITYQGEHWHADRSFWAKPTAVTLLRAVHIPKVGGDTMFANMYMAYETLSDGMKKLIGGLQAIHFGGISANRRELGLETPPVVHPLVPVHPETGRKGLYMGEFPKVIQFVGMTEEESRPLLDFLCKHATRPQFCYRHRWQQDDLLIWDNRCLMHNALGDYDRTQDRNLERTQVLYKEPTGHPYEGPLHENDLQRLNRLLYRH